MLALGLFGFGTSLVSLASCMWVPCWFVCKKMDIDSDERMLVGAFWPLAVSCRNLQETTRRVCAWLITVFSWAC